MNIKLRTFGAGAVGMLVVFGVVELVHGLYQPIPSVLVAVAQRIIEFTPGDFATRAVETLDKADIPVLITVTLLGTLVFAGFLAYLSLRSWVLAIIGVAVLAAIALAASFTEPQVAYVPTVLTVLGALGAGSAVAGFLLYTSGHQASESAPEPKSPEGRAALTGCEVEGGALGAWNRGRSPDLSHTQQ